LKKKNQTHRVSQESSFTTVASYCWILFPSHLFCYFSASPSVNVNPKENLCWHRASLLSFQQNSDFHRETILVVLIVHHLIASILRRDELQVWGWQIPYTSTAWECKWDDRRILATFFQRYICTGQDKSADKYFESADVVDFAATSGTFSSYLTLHSEWCLINFIFFI
jgi:hypothetical protein